MICHFLPLVFISFFIQPTTYKNVVKYFDARWLMTIRRQCTYSCMLFEHTNRTRHKNTLVALPLFFPVPFLLVGAYSGESRGMSKKNGGIYGRSERRALHFHSREAQTEPTSRVRRVLKSLRSLLLSPTLPRGQRSSRHLEQSPVVFTVASSP